MDQALIQVGLPVRCSTCLTSGFVKPGTDHGGWKFVTLLGKKRWYCPKDAKEVTKIQERAKSYSTPQPEPDNTEELYKLLD